MKARCIVCEKIDILDNDSVEARRLKNHPIRTYMCTNCNDKITQKTNQRMKQGKYKLYKGEAPVDII